MSLTLNELDVSDENGVEIAFTDLVGTPKRFDNAFIIPVYLYIDLTTMADNASAILVRHIDYIPDEEVKRFNDPKRKSDGKISFGLSSASPGLKQITMMMHLPTAVHERCDFRPLAELDEKKVPVSSYLSGELTRELKGNMSTPLNFTTVRWRSVAPANTDDAAGFDVAGCHALDVGASTGGFTQVLLERGAARSVALDVGIDQLADILRNDPRVIVMEGVNARDLEADDLPYAPDLIVSDVSFISLRLVLPPVLKLAASGARGVFLFKPQFEVGRDGLGKGGIVRGDADVEGALAAVLDVIRDAGWQIDAVCDAPIAGGDGNRERLIAASASTPPHA